jgi:acetate kinase
MDELILVLNSGSSSLKFSAYGIDTENLNLIVRGLVDGLGNTPHFTAQNGQGERIADVPLKDNVSSTGHAEALAIVFDWLRRQFAERYSLVAVGHRIVHGGLNYSGPALIDTAVMNELKELVPLVPLHQPHNLEAVTAVRRMRPDIPQVACFDTAFHRYREKVTERFGLPEAMFHQGVRRWGFHGLSYESIATKFQVMSPAEANGRLIIAHLGNGASLCAIRNRRSVDTTMSLTALDGLPMGTRCGTLDPGALLYLLQRGMKPAEIEDLLYRQSGLLGISGVSNDVRRLLDSSQPLAAEAIEFFVYRVMREIGSLAAALGGLDALIFTAGIGENSPLIRRRVCQGLAWLNLNIEEEKNEQNATRLSIDGQTPSVWVIPTDEESVIATHTLRLIRKSG